MRNLLFLAVGLAGSAFSAAEQKIGIDDAQIAHVVVSANDMTVEVSRLAGLKSSSEEVKALAHQVAREHSNVNKAVAELATRLEWTPRDSPISQELKADGENHLAELNVASGEEFNKAYIDQVVAFHQNLLDLIDNTLMPNVKNQELAALLFGLFAPLSDHLERAQQIQK
jgi:putative membrane protein